MTELKRVGTSVRVIEPLIVIDGSSVRIVVPRPMADGWLRDRCCLSVALASESKV